MNTLLEIVAPGFLLRDALIGSVLVGILCSLVGVYFVLRRMIFLGVALPQVSAAGIACTFLLYRLFLGQPQRLMVHEWGLALLGSFTFTFGGLLALVALERYRDTVEARMGVTYAVAAAATMLFLAADPAAEAHMVNLLKGDILATTGPGLALLSGLCGVVAVVLVAFHKELLLVSFDRELAIVFGKRAGLWDGVLYLVIGTTISLGVMTAGPLVTFGFLVIPPLTARSLTHRMLTFALTAAALGASTAFAGFYCAYRYDWPLGPAEVALASVVLVAVESGSGVCRFLARRKPARATGRSPLL